jgi:hypothetical protein
LRAPGAADRAGAALREAAGLRCAIDLEGRARRETIDALRAAGLAEDVLAGFASILHRLEEVAFAPGASDASPGVATDALRMARAWRDECRP